MKCPSKRTTFRVRIAGGLVWLLVILALGLLIAAARPVGAEPLPSAPGLQDDLFLFKSARTESGSSAVVFNGEYVTYTLVLSNPSAVTATHIVLLDTLPEDTLDNIRCLDTCYKTIEVQEVLDPLGDIIVVTVTRQISWAVPLLQPGDAVTEAFSARVTGQTDGTEFSNRGFVSYEQDGVPKSGLSNDLGLLVRLPIEKRGGASLSSAPTWFSTDLGGALSLDWGDYDHDGDLDLALGTSAGTAVYRNDAGRLVRFWGNDLLTYGVRWADFDGDGGLELVAVGDSEDLTPATAGKNYVYRSAAAEFVQVQEFASDFQLVRVAPGDFDGDGHVDLVLSTNSINAACPVLLYRNTLDAGAPFSDTGDCISTEATAAIGPGDYDNDDDLDLILGQFPNQIQIFKNGCNGSPLTDTNPFTSATSLLVDDSASFLPYDFAWGDYDGDGYLDLAAAYPLGRTARIYHNEQGSGFAVAQDLQTSLFRTPLALDWGDFDGDGCLDLAVADAPPRIYSSCRGPFTEIMALAADAVEGQVWSLRGVDQDGDADLDLSLSNRDGPSLSFTSFAPPLKPDLTPIPWSSSAATAGVAWGDADADGDLDLLFGAGQGAVATKLYLNDGGQFPLAAARPFLPTGFGPHSVALGDVNGDGQLDVAVALGTTAGNQLYLAGHTDAADWISAPPHTPSHSLAWADADGDGDLDLLVGNNGPNALYLNQGALLNTSPAWTAGVSDTRSVAWADFDGDRYPDFAVGNALGANQVYRNNRDNTFSLAWASTTVSNTTSVAWADFDGDGDPDLAVGNNGAANLLYENEGGVLGASPIWRSAEMSATTSLAWGDWDNDGDPDLAVGNDSQADQVYANLNSRPGVPQLHWLWTSAERQRTSGLAWGDRDGDGDLDLAISQRSSGHNGFYENTYVSPSHLGDAFAPTLPLPRNPSYLAVERPGSTADAFFRSSAEILSGPGQPTVTVHYRLFDPDGTRDDSVPSDAAGTRVVSTLYEFSLDGGGTWQPATPVSNAPPPPTTTSRLGLEATFLWDAVADQAISDDARFRVSIIHDDPTGPVQRASTSAVSPPFRVRGTTCVWPRDPFILVSDANPDPGEEVRLEGGVVEGSGILTFTWDFGDGTTDRGQVVYHTYAANNTYHVVLTVRSEPCPIAKEVVATRDLAVGTGTPGVYLPFVANAATISATGQVGPLPETELREPSAVGSPSPVGESILDPPPSAQPQPARVDSTATPPGQALAPAASTPLAAIPVTEELLGISNRPSLSADGRFVTFWSTGNPPVAGHNADGNIEVFGAEVSDTGLVTFTQFTSSTGSILGGFNLDPAIDDSGAAVVFFSDRDLVASGDNADANFELFLAQVNHAGALTLTQLSTTTGGSNLSPVLSGDGTRVAFASNQDLDSGGDNGDDSLEIFVLDRAAAHIWQISDSPPGVINDQPAINTDGRLVAFVRDGQILLAHVGASGTVTLTQVSAAGSHACRQPAINGDASVDRVRIAYSADNDIVLAEIGAGGDITWTQVTSSPGVVDDQPAISADGNRIAFVSGNRIAVYEVGSAALQTIQPENARQPAVSADGTHIAFVSNRDIWLASSPRADLSISKQSEPSTMIPGDLVTYTLVVRNAGPSDVVSTTTNVTSTASVSDVLPTEILNPAWSCTATSGSHCPPAGSGPVLDEAISLRAGGVVTYTVTGTLAPSTTANVINTALVTVPAGFIDWDPGNNQDDDINILSPEADLTVVKASPADPVAAGSVLTYTLTYTNDGPSDAGQVRLTDTLPAGVTFGGVVSPPPGWSAPALVGQQVIWSRPSLAAGAGGSIVLTVTVDSNLLTGTVLTNRLVITSTTPDPDPASNVSDAATTIETEADLSVVKAGDRNPATAGTVLAYTLTYGNAGPSDARQVRLTDTLPAEVTFGGVVSQPPGWSAASTMGQQVSWSRPTLVAGDGGEIVMTVTVNADVLTGTVLTNRLVLTTTTPDPNPADNAVSVTTTVDTEADLTIAKSAAPNPVAAGATLIYTLTYTNDGPSDAAQVRLTDTLPAEVAFGSVVSQPPGWTTPPTTTGQLVSWSRPTLAAGGGGSIVLIVIVDSDVLSNTVLSNGVVLTATTPDPDPIDNADSAATTIETEANLAVLRVDAPSPATAGAVLTYTLTYTNAGPSDAGQVRLTDTLPAEVTFGGVVSQPPGWSAASTMGQQVSWSRPTLVAGEGGDIVLTVTVDSAVLTGTLLTNSAVITATTPDTDPADNAGDADTTVETEADLAVVKASDPDPAVAGAVLTCILTYTNDGPSDAQAVRLTDTLPAEVAFGGVVSQPPGWTAPTQAGQQVSWSRPTLAAGASDSFILTVTLDSDVLTGTVLTNSLVITAATPDPDPADNRDDAGTTIETEADLAVVKADDPDPVAAGAVLAYTLTYTNAGPSDAAQVHLTDTLPAEVAFGGVVSQPPGWTAPAQAGQQVSWSRTTLAEGASGSFVLTVTVADHVTDLLSNTADVAASSPDPNPGDNHGEATTALLADLAIDKTSFPAQAVPGEAITYTLTVTNLGPSYVASAVVSDAIPAEIDGVSWTCLASVGSTCAAGGVGNALSDTVSLEPGGRLTYTITGDLDAQPADTLRNTATVTVPAWIVDANPADNRAPDLNNLSPRADLVATKVVDRAQPNEGDTIVYTLTVRNNGPSGAIGVQLTDTLPSGVGYVSSAASRGVYSGVSGVWTGIGDLAVSEAVTLTLMVTVETGTAGTTITNSVNGLAASRPPDPNPGNNTPDAAIVVNSPPSFASAPVTGATQDVYYNYSIATDDADAGDVLTITAPISPTWLTLVDNGDRTATLSGTPTNSDVGDHAVTLQVQDSGGLTDSQAFTITVTNVNDPPSADDDTAATDEDTPVSNTVSASDPDDDPLSYGLHTPPAYGDAAVVGDTWTYTPANRSADYETTFAVVVTDPGGLTDTAAITVSVSADNDPPTAAADTATTISSTPVTLTVLLNDTDPDDAASLSVGSVGVAVSGTTSISGTTAVVYSPTNFVGTDTFTYTVSDGSLTDTATVTVRVNPFALTISGPSQGLENTTYTFTATVDAAVTLPITYAWQATGQASALHPAVSSLSDTISYAWPAADPQTITVTATCSEGTAIRTHVVTIRANRGAGGRSPAPGGYQIYLPLLWKQE